MGQPKGKEQGTRTPLDLRAGIDIDRFVGVHTDRDPGAIPRNALQRGRNVRLSGGVPTSRGGQEKIITSPIDSAWDGLYDAGCGDGSLRLYLAGLPVDSLLWAIAAESVAPSLYGYRSSWNPVVASLAATDPYAGYLLRFVRVGDGIYAVGYKTQTLHLFSVQLGAGENPDVLTLTPIDESSFASNNPYPAAFGGSLFFVTNVSAVAGDVGVYRYTPGSSVVLEFSGSNVAQYIGENGTDLYTISGIPASRFLKRNNGAYTLLSYPAVLDAWDGTGNFWGPMSTVGVRIGSTVYFVGFGTNGASSDVVIVSIAGTTVAYQNVLPNIPLADQPYDSSSVAFNGLIYWLQRRGSTLVLARSNGTSYAEPADFTSLFGISTSAPRNACLVAGSGNLYLIASSSIGNVKVFKSAGTDDSSWALLGTFTGSGDLKPNPGSAIALQ